MISPKTSKRNWNIFLRYLNYHMFSWINSRKNKKIHESILLLNPRQDDSVQDEENDFPRTEEGPCPRFSSRESTTARKTSSLLSWNFETAMEIERFQARERFEGAVHLFFVPLNISQVFHYSSWRQNLVTRDARLASKERREIILDPSPAFLWFYPRNCGSLVEEKKDGSRYHSTRNRDGGERGGEGKLLLTFEKAWY